MRNFTRNSAHRARSSFTRSVTGALLVLVSSVPATVDAFERLANISTRARVSTGDDVAIAGFIVEGSNKCVVVRGRGRSMEQFGVTGTLPDPSLKVFSGSTLLIENDDWGSGESAANVRASGMHTLWSGGPEMDPSESAIYGCFTAGNYTVVLSDKNNDSGRGIIEVFDVDSAPEGGVDPEVQAQIDGLTALVNSLQSQVNSLQAMAHERYSDSEAIAAISPYLDTGGGGDHLRYTDAEAIAAVTSLLAPVATSGSYTDLSGKPSLFSGNYADLTGKPSLFSGKYADLTGQPNLATVATTGSYYDLSDAPDAGGGDYGALLSGISRVTVDGVDTFRFTGMNVQIVNGMGSSSDASSVNGKGNLIIGYNETNEAEMRNGSHNLIVGPYHSYAGQSGVVFGWDNEVQTAFATITGGKVNTISAARPGNHQTITGGSQNLAEGNYTAILGGQGNHARDGGSSVHGGYGNKAYSIRASVTGGNSIICTTQDGVCGG